MRVRMPTSTSSVNRAIQSVDAALVEVLERARAGPLVERIAAARRSAAAADVAEDGRRLIAEGRREIARRHDRQQRGRPAVPSVVIATRIGVGGAHRDHAVGDRRVGRDCRRRLGLQLGDRPIGVAAAVGHPGEQRARASRSAHESGLGIDDGHRRRLRCGPSARAASATLSCGRHSVQRAGHLVQEHPWRVGPLVGPLEVGRHRAERRDVLAGVRILRARGLRSRSRETRRGRRRWPTGPSRDTRARR